MGFKKKQIKANKTVLFISYDGLLDPLGQSQILPYIMGIVKHTKPIHVLSFEKNFRFKDNNIALNTYLKEQEILHATSDFTYVESENMRNVGNVKIELLSNTTEWFKLTHVCLPENWLLQD